LNPTYCLREEAETEPRKSQRKDGNNSIARADDDDDDDEKRAPRYRSHRGSVHRSRIGMLSISAQSK
jgi:hypothetical protein